MIAIGDMGGEIFGLGINGVEVRSDPLKGEMTVYYPITLSSCQTIIDVRIGEEECLNWSIYTWWWWKHVLFNAAVLIPWEELNLVKHS